MSDKFKFQSYVLCVCFFCFSSHIQAQSSVKGLVFESSGEPLAFANILLFQTKDSLFQKAELVEETGIFHFADVPSGEYYIEISMIGYQNVFTKSFTLSAQQQIIDLGSFTLQSNVSLDMVEIVAKRPLLEQKIDRTVVNVSNTITNAGGNALEVLQRAPGVQVNRLSNSISLVGKPGVIIMVNGKISRLPPDAILQMLEGMNADNIDKIELIHTPPSNFDAEGNAGIINIVLKSTNDDGLNGNYFANAGRGRGNKYGGGVNFNFRKKKINVFGGYDRKYNLNPQKFTNYRGVFQNNDFLETDTRSNRSHTPLTTQNVKLGLDYDISEKTVIGVLAGFNDRNWYMEAVNSTTAKTNGVITSRIRMPNVETNHSTTFSGNINLTHKFSENQSLNLDADIVNIFFDNPSEYNIQTDNGSGVFRNDYSLRLGKETPIQVFVSKADYLYKVKNIRFESGVKLTHYTFDNNIQVDSISEDNQVFNFLDYSSKAHLDEYISAAYTSASFLLNEKLECKAGLRYEYTNTDLASGTGESIVDREYGSLFPSVFISYKVSEQQQLSVSYSRRVFRPQISQLAPFLVFSDPSTLLGGNPSLQPSFTNAYKIEYAVRSIKFSLAYNSENAPIRFVPTIDVIKNRQLNSFDNLDNETVYSANVYFPLNPTQWWEITSSVFINSSRTKLTIENVNIVLDNINYGFNTNSQFILPKKYTVEVSGNYTGPYYFGLLKFRSLGSLNIGVQKDLGDKWGKIRGNVSDIFMSSNLFGSTDQPQNNLLVDVSIQFAERVFMLSWTNTFGSQKLKSSRNRSTGASEEMQRI